MNQIQVTCDKECIYRNDGFCECDQHLLDIAEEFLRLKRGEEVEHLKERESIGAASMEDCSKYEWDFLHESIAELDGYPYAIGLKNKNLIESKVVHPGSEYDYVDMFDDDEADWLDYDCRYSHPKPDLKESKDISAEQESMKEDIVKKNSFLITKEMIAVGIHQTIFSYEGQNDGKIKVILYPSNASFMIDIESLYISSDIRKVEIIFSCLRTQYRSMDAKLFNEIQENIIDQYIQYMAYEGIKKINTLDFHVRMQECDLLKLYDLYIYHLDRNHLMVNGNSCDKDVCGNRYANKYANTIGEKININDFEDVLVGNCYERDLKRFSKIYDGSFKDFLELFDFEANGIYRIHDFTCADGVLIGRKMEFVFDKLF